MSIRLPLFLAASLCLLSATAFSQTTLPTRKKGSDELPTSKAFDPFAKKDKPAASATQRPAGATTSATTPKGRAEEQLPEAFRACGLSDCKVAEIMPGLTYYHAHAKNLFAKENDVHILRFDYKNCDARLAYHESCETARKLRTTSEVAKDYGAIAAVNGGFFTWKLLLPSYVAKVRGKLIKTERAGGSGIAFNDKDKEYVFGNLSAATIEKYDNAFAGDFVLSGGRNQIPESQKNAGPAPRTLLGRAPGDILWIFVIDGRQKGFSIGINYWEGAELMKMFGCTDGFNHDGGGSSTMVVRKGALSGKKHSGAATTKSKHPDVEVLNRPSDGTERKVLDQLLILDARSSIPE